MDFRAAGGNDAGSSDVLANFRYAPPQRTYSELSHNHAAFIQLSHHFTKSFSARLRCCFRECQASRTARTPRRKHARAHCRAPQRTAAHTPQTLDTTLTHPFARAAAIPSRVSVAFRQLHAFANTRRKRSRTLNTRALTPPARRSVVTREYVISFWSLRCSDPLRFRYDK